MCCKILQFHGKDYLKSKQCEANTQLHSLKSKSFIICLHLKGFSPLLNLEGMSPMELAGIKIFVCNSPIVYQTFFFMERECIEFISPAGALVVIAV